MELIGIIAALVIVRAIANVFEDIWSTIKNQPNQRMKRARTRRERDTPIWDQLHGWLADVVADARVEAGRRRDERRERQAEQRRKKDLDDHPTQDAEWWEEDEPASLDPRDDPDEPDVYDYGTPDPREPECKYGAPMSQNCGYEWCPTHGTKHSQPDNEQQSNGGDDMSEVQGLDQAIAYARTIAASAGQHGTAGNEGYIGHLTQREVTGQALQSAYDMQAAFAAAMVAAETHATELEKQKAVQEQYDSNPDAGDKQFQTTGR